MTSHLLSKKLGKRRSYAAVALALAGGATLATAALESPASAQRAGKKDRKEQAKANYSEVFVKVYQPAAQAAQANPNDAAALQAQVPAVVAAASTPDDKFAAGQFVLNAGTKASDMALQRRGLAMMLESGKVPAADVGRFNFGAAQLAYQAEDYAQARTYLEAAMQAGYAENDPRLLLIETYSKQNDAAGALRYLDQVVEQQIAAGQTPPRNYLEKGLTTAYNAQMMDQALRYADLSARYYPDAKSWGDAITVVRAGGSLTDDETLDLLRLQRKTNSFRDGREYLGYIELADPRRLPSEVGQVINEGYTSGLLDRGNAYASEALKEAQGREASVRADLTGLERDASASGAKLTTVLAAGNVFMNVGQPAKAEEFYRKALTMPGVNTVTVTNRLGMSLVEQGKFAEAAAAFNQVENQSKVARLWSSYAEQQGGGTVGG